MMNRFIEHIGNLYSIILTILTLFLGEHWILFMVLLLLNIIDTLTGWIKSRINKKQLDLIVILYYYYLFCLIYWYYDYFC